MHIDLDTPLSFSAGFCQLCRKKDENWVALQYLNDGMWRKLTPGKSLRDHGLDEQSMSYVYCIHACAETIALSLASPREMTLFLMRLYERF